MFFAVVVMCAIGGQGCEHQTILNIREQSRFYVWAILPSHTTQIPIINGVMPVITKFPSNKLVLDYGCGYVCYVPPGGFLNYEFSQQTCSTPRSQPRVEPPKATTPRVLPEPINVETPMPVTKQKIELTHPQEPTKQKKSERAVDPLSPFLRYPSEN